MANWGYKPENGPHTWAENYAEAAGERQSPIDIQTNEASLDPDLSGTPLKWTWPDGTEDITNTGYGWKAHVHGEGSCLTGGPLNEDVYQLEQFHAHWGKDGSCGSEHLVDGQSFAAEIHFVHWNTKYGSLGEALKHGDGLAVLGVFVKEGKEHEGIKPLIKLLPDIRFKEQTVKFEHDKLDPSQLLPGSHAYWTYPGSLTTPPCNECVIWIVFKEVIEMSSEQLDAFRSLNSLCKEQCTCEDEPGEPVHHNFRPCCPKGKRCIRASFT